MTTLLAKAVARIQKLPANEQDGAAEFLQDYAAAAEQAPRLSAAQVAEVGRRLAEKSPKTLTWRQFTARLKRRGML